ncbi:MAG: lipid A deacylase LpxR family protein [Gemmatimonadota bacterium]|jgi:hypothetical protein
MSVGWPQQVLALTLVALLVGPTDTVSGQGLGAARLAFDNDGLSVWIPPSRRTDWFYTHGTRLDVTVDWTPTRWVVPGGEGLAMCEDGIMPCLVTRLGLSQEIYTPRNLFFFTPGLGDRPYAGWLSATLSTERVEPGRSTELSMELGVTGPPSLGEDVHLTIHRWLDKAEPRGWEHQLPFEVAGAISFQEAWRWPAVGEGRGRSVALQPHWRGTLGTLRTSGQVGLALRLGWNAPPSVAWTGPASDGPYLLAVFGTEGELVVRDLFLDGSLWRDTDRTVREPLLTRERIRVAAGWGSIGIELGVTRESPAFKRQKSRHTWSTVGLVVHR